MDRPSVTFGNHGSIGRDSNIRRFGREGLPVVALTAHEPKSGPAEHLYAPYVEADLANPRFRRLVFDSMRQDDFASRFIQPLAKHGKALTLGTELRRDLLADTELPNQEDIGGIDQQAYDRIVALQPCAMHKEWSYLAQIQTLDNTDKHRLLLAAAASTRIRGWNFRDEHGIVTTLPHDSFVPLQVDAMVKVQSPPPEWVLRNLANEVAFIEPGPVWGKPMDDILGNLSCMTRETVNTFAECF